MTFEIFRLTQRWTKNNQGKVNPHKKKVYNFVTHFTVIEKHK